MSTDRVAGYNLIESGTLVEFEARPRLARMRRKELPGSLSRRALDGAQRKPAKIRRAC